VVTVDAGADEEALKAAALADQKIAALLAGKEVLRIIVVPRKLINIVVK
jgi:leucyl-tRNA synthetase